MDSITKKCTKCCETKNISEFPVWRGKTISRCKECIKGYSKKWHTENRGKVNANVRRWRKENPEKDKADRQKYRDNHRKERQEKGIALKKRQRITVIEAYGGKCSCCGESRYEFLAVDHINNDGNIMRKGVHPKSPYGWLIRNNFPKENFQILCHNCNCAKGFYGYCPHEKEVRPA